MNYSSLIKDVVSVTPSAKKANELKSAIAHLKHPVREKKDIKRLYEPSMLGINKERRNISTSFSQSQYIEESYNRVHNSVPINQGG